MSPIALDASSKTEPVLSLNWKEDSPGIWKRGLDESEIFWNLAARKEVTFFPIYGSASFKIGTLGPEVSEQEKEQVDLAFKKAWLTLRNVHPSLLSYVVRDGDDQFTRIYSSLKSEEDASTWADSTFKSIFTDGSAIDWFNKEKPICHTPTVFLIHSREGENSNFTLFLQFPHEIADGVGATHLIHQLFEIAGRAFEQKESFKLPEWGSEGVRLSSCLKVAANIPEELSDVQKERLGEIQKLTMGLLSHPDIMRVPASPPSDGMTTGNRERISVIVSKEQSAKIFAECKNIASGVTVNHAATVATARALAQLQPRRETSYSARLLVFAMMDLRPYLREPFGDPSQSVGAYCCIAGKGLGVDAVVPGLTPDTENDTSDDFKQLAIEARDHFQSLKTAKCGKLHEQLSFASLGWAAFTPKPGHDIHAIPDPPTGNLPVSCIGDMSRIVSSDYGCFHLTNAWVISESMNSADVPVFFHTWDGQFELSSMFDNRYHTAQGVEEFLRRTVDIMAENLHVAEDNLQV